MKKFAAAIVFAMLISCLGPAASASERAPSYLILRAPTRVHKGHANYTGRGYEVRTQTYAYGWFGAQPRRHFRRSAGYNESYIQRSRQ